MTNHNFQLIEKSKKLRAKGFTFDQIKQKLNIKVPKSTLSYWVRDVEPPESYYQKIRKSNNKNLARIRPLAVAVNRIKREKYLEQLKQDNRVHLKKIGKSTGKLILATLYMAEGTKGSRGSLQFGNSDPGINKLFLRLLRDNYLIDESKFRCRVMCRADQNPEKLMKFWRQVTGIPLKQFYRTGVDSRTIGKVTKNKHYMGVCAITYFSGHIHNDLIILSGLLKDMGL